MDSENEKKPEGVSAEQNAGGREGYQPSSQSGDYQNYRAAGRSPRPRIHNPRPYNDQDRGSYNKSSNDEGGFRPDGFGSGLQGGSSQRPYRPRYNNNDSDNRGGYNRDGGGYNRGGYNNNRGGGYNSDNRGGGGYRPRYNNNDGEGGGYQQRSGGYNSDNRGGGGYRPRYNNNDGEGGGYQQRSSYNSDNRSGGYNRGGYNNNRGGYDNRGGGGYNSDNRSGGYNRDGGGYNRGGYNNNRGGYDNRGGGYNRDGGGYNRGGYNNNRGGYDNRGGGGYRQHSSDYDPNAKYSYKKRIEYKEENYDPNEPIRLNKFLANAGVCSRREADEFIQAGVVSVNGTVVTELGSKVMRTDEVKFHDSAVSIEKKVYVLLNKPKDYVTTSDDPQQRKTVMDLVKNACQERIYPVGRLDRNTTGVLLLTNDGDLASKLTHPKFLKKKVYHVYLDKNITAHDIQQIAEGVTLDDGEIKPDAVEYADPDDKKQVGIEIHSGKNRIVRRIFESLDYRVTKLDRVLFAGLTKKNLRRGEWRYLTEEEVDRLRMGAYE